MKSTTLAAVAVSMLATGTNAYIGTFYSEPGCQGNSYSRNVYDNTCAAPTGMFQSFMLTTYGASGQYMKWYSDGQCTLPGEIGCEGAQNGYPLYQCHEMNLPGQPAYGLASYAIQC